MSLENGIITQSGTHNELIKEEGLYNLLQGKPELIEDSKTIDLGKGLCTNPNQRKEKLLG